MNATRPPTDRVRVKRLPKRGHYDRSIVDAILDEALVCHVGFVADGQPHVVPTIHARDGDRLYVHGSAASRTLRALGDGVPVCVTATIVDGLVLARSAFHHSMNYRSVMVLGTAVEVTHPAQKLAGLRAVAEHVAPGRWDEIRPPSRQELRQTSLLRLGLDEASAKVRSGPPIDDEDDLSLAVWAGELPIRSVTLPAVPDPLLAPGIPPPAWLARYDRRVQGPPRRGS